MQHLQSRTHLRTHPTSTVSTLDIYVCCYYINAIIYCEADAARICQLILIHLQSTLQEGVRGCAQEHTGDAALATSHSPVARRRSSNALYAVA